MIKKPSFSRKSRLGKIYYKIEEFSMISRTLTRAIQKKINTNLFTLLHLAFSKHVISTTSCEKLGNQPQEREQKWSERGISWQDTELERLEIKARKMT